MSLFILICKFPALLSLTLVRAQRQQVELERQARGAKPQEITPEIRAKIDAAAKLF